ncbi:guanitoxin biosynthesis L-enduracididine beta-hydroxylase GntD [Streptomyces sp. NBC_01353]|uniref:guanitoxin biosynthesis L-enduracididine beta-hydroxylase GntD n=1 Tax=Streptomyces sp. NBC_01353 TaxID=2903835 RepID=UPI002E355153|nr:guanitoxin biosynthesis L-enduracididine beta-hydroxylase GntD [Streptomyces sp. NBC_01353]
MSSVLTYDLSTAEIDQLEAVVARLLETGLDPAEPSFSDELWRYVPGVPAGLRGFLQDFRTREPAAACMVRGLPVDDGRVGPTPLHWTAAADSTSTRREEAYLALLTVCLGEVFGWSTLQRGRLVQNVLPIPGEEGEQSGHGSDVLLEWHTEDGFHPYRCDYLGLFGVRNVDEVPTTLASVRDIELSEEHRAVLQQKRYFILPDDEHLRQLRAVDPDAPSLAKLQQMRDEPEAVAVLFGAPEDPYLRIDPFFMRHTPGDEEGRAALDALVDALDKVMRDVVVGAGSLLFVDNYLAVHGRRAFTSRYDGTDRWLKKTVSTRDLRKSRDLRSHAQDRVFA